MNLHHCAIVLVFVFGASAGAAAQQHRDTTQASDTVKDLPLTAGQRQSFVGSYSVTLPLGGENDLLRVFDENGVLKAQSMHDKETRRLVYQGDAAFRPEGIPDFVITFVLEGGRATKFTARRPEGVMKGVRIR
jgi:hypothetical protein